MAGALTLAGCSTTQQTAARLQLESYREIAAQNATVVRRASTTLTAQAVSLVRGGTRTVYLVTVHNAAAHAVSDLPISVGYETARGRRPIYANASESLTYFQSHLGLIAAHSTVTWLYDGGAVPAGARPFALIGTQAPANISAAPKISANDWRFTLGADGVLDAKLRVQIANQTGVPQFGLPVYAYVQKSGRDVAAGTAVVGALNPGARAVVDVPIVGTLGGGQLHLEVLPADAR